MPAQFVAIMLVIITIHFIQTKLLPQLSITLHLMINFQKASLLLVIS